MQCCTGTPTCTGIPAKLLTHAQSFRELIALTMEPSQQQHVKTSSWRHNIPSFSTTRDTTVAGDVFLSSPHAWCHNFKSISGGAYREVIQFHVGCVGPSNAVDAYVHSLYSATRRFRVKLQRLLSFLLSNVHSSAGARRLPGSISTGFLTLLTTPDQDRTTSKVKEKL